ncbi:MAG: hypothetical protein EWV55_06535 [Microcystis viridis Mv_BB_P_19951000_S69]|uniref:Uncharacterized protein n=1 Tax=Microcystis viridis Mv_BB_P_19951000_S68D TaxID=2486270 RepID=A0A552I2I6_MICVR|nr:MAG: hypothetical protein EWV55_06535 [Microcystis viridis Mv_BB_P_19951000_S69]TRU76886.1 MAG: hypothetical protein EWV47_05270 [Microcystis viridis Mv_BB_P_19951000_S68]TRU77694.1 MAG: hypothetical protein EWV77_05375 [Microcystis viridis Mv_BB_P_19951000_S68D]TRU90739.1 MAG: hypothetical protein EWV46_00920 [Microcystis viridis Mv_BB_P_19951000_S69D]
MISPDEKIFTPTDERGFLPYTPHPTTYTLFQVSDQESVISSQYSVISFFLPTPQFPSPKTSIAFYTLIELGSSTAAIMR